jgi:hypothetical protein
MKCYFFVHLTKYLSFIFDEGHHPYVFGTIYISYGLQRMSQKNNSSIDGAKFSQTIYDKSTQNHILSIMGA